VDVLTLNIALDAPDRARFSIGRCEIDLTSHTITRNAGPLPAARPAAGQPATPAAGQPATPSETVHLTPTEWRLLEILLTSAGQLVSSDRLLTEVWGPDSSAAPTTCGFTWPGSAASWKTIRRALATC
jgi:DNA-binding response OmpR family regulator